MAIIVRNDLRPGMTLAQDVADRHGRLLLGTGTILEDKHIRMLKLWGIPSIKVMDDAPPDGKTPTAKPDSVVGALPVGPSPEALERARALAFDLFHHNLIQRKHPLFPVLLSYCVHEATRGTKPDRPTDNGGLLRDKSAGKGGGVGRPPSMTELVSSVREVASLPAVYHQLVQVVNDPRSSAADVAKVISGDPGLTARLLRLVNSAMYGFPGRIETVSRAVALVGMSELCELALATSVIGTFGGALQRTIHMGMFWRHCLACGVIARGLAKALRMPNEERLFVTGLLHDVGRLVMFARMPDTMARALEEADTERIPVVNAELTACGYTHMGVGRALLLEWQLPESHAEPAGCHHKPGAAKRFVVESAIIHVADVFAHALRIGGSGDRRVPPLDPAAWDRLELSPEAAPPLLEEARMQVAELAAVFDLEKTR
ncbi:MAG TPA: HDOD domain-containing protein [Candidatus Hydrogenedentes bacterium]|nr:HDOD domain-containing protein [Candidatus Hydrogenedentota bacterium]HNT86751.1 HDOD domain-containing protein [Candidatus Hydrogenedentota bacterium]